MNKWNSKRNCFYSILITMSISLSGNNNLLKINKNEKFWKKVKLITICKINFKFTIFNKYKILSSYYRRNIEMI